MKTEKEIPEKEKIKFDVAVKSSRLDLAFAFLVGILVGGIIFYLIPLSLASFHRARELERVTMEKILQQSQELKECNKNLTHEMGVYEHLFELDRKMFAEELESKK